MKNLSRKEALQAQITATQAYLMEWHAVVVSGAYKQRNLQKIASEDPEPIIWRRATDEEKLAHAVQALQAHAKRIGELTDLLLEEEV